MSFTVKSSGVPVGSYRVRFVRWEQSTHDEYGERVLFVFVVIGGPENGEETSRFTSAKLTQNTALGKIAFGLAGRKLEKGDDFNPDDYIGQEYLAIVEETKSGSTRVSSLLPVQE